MRERDYSIDGMKGTLVIMMILAHIVQFFSCGIYGEQFSLYVNLTTFSGFMFTSGYACYSAYISSNMANSVLIKKISRNVFKTLIAFYISGISYVILIERDLTKNALMRILTFDKIPGYSEFLLSFLLVYILVYFFRPILAKMNGCWIGICCILSLLMTCIDYQLISMPLLGGLIGTTLFPCFPIIQYASYWLVGMYLSAKNIVYNNIILLTSLLGTSGFVIYCRCLKQIPLRFPPSAIWIIGGYFFVLLYFVIWKKCGVFLKHLSVVQKIGQKSLIYLVFSNILIFAIHRTNIFQNVHGIIGRSIFYFVCFFGCVGIPYLYFNRSNRTLSIK